MQVSHKLRTSTMAAGIVASLVLVTACGGDSTDARDPKVGVEDAGDTGFDDSTSYDDDTGYDDSTSYDDDTGYDDSTSYDDDTGYDDSTSYDDDTGYDDTSSYDDDTGYDDGSYDDTGDPGQGGGDSTDPCAFAGDPLCPDTPISVPGPHLPDW